MKLTNLQSFRTLKNSSNWFHLRCLRVDS